MNTSRHTRFSFFAVVAIFLPVFLLLANCSGGGSGGGTSPDKQTNTPVPTAVGTTSGSLVSKTIGTAGGSVSSSGTTTVSVVIPAGALAADTVVGIQPITNQAPGALGTAYRLTLSSGATFLAPVQITFPYTDEDLKGTTSDALGMAFQDEKGFWRSVKDVTLDPVAKTLTVSTTHFSDWSRLIGWQIRPPEATIKPGDSIGLTVNYCEPVDDGDVTTLLSSCWSDASLSPLVSGWAVNSIPKGNLAVGTVNGSGGTASYQSPLDAQGTYAVSAQLKKRDGSNVLLVSNITVTSNRVLRYAGSMTHTYVSAATGGGTNSSMTITVTFDWDEASGTYLPTGAISFSGFESWDLPQPGTIAVSCEGAIGHQDGLLTLYSYSGNTYYWYLGPTVTCTETTTGNGNTWTRVYDSEMGWTSNGDYLVQPDGAINYSHTEVAPYPPDGTSEDKVAWRFAPS